MHTSVSTAVGLALAAVMVAASSTASGMTLAEKGTAATVICLSQEAAEPVRDGAKDLARVLSAMCGGTFEIRASADKADVPAGAIVLGQLAAELGCTMAKSSRAGDGFRYAVHEGRLCIVGESPPGVYHGIFAFLESLGCGWYAPGPLGEVIPKRKTVAVADDVDRTEVSDSVNRRFWYGGKNAVGEATDKWRRRNGAGLRLGSWRHAWGGLVPKDKYFKEHPEYFSLNRGKRTGKQLCTTNPDTIRIAAESLKAQMARGEAVVYPAGPNDGGNLCECAECSKLDTPGYLEPSSGKLACGSRIFKFASDCAEITARAFPDRDLGVLVYSEYSRIPLRLKRLHPNVFPMFAPIRRCRVHGPGNPLCPWNMLWQEEIQAWGKLTEKMGFYIYNFNLADTLVPMSKVSCYRRLLGEVHELNIKQLAWVFETIDSWAMYAPHLYLSVRLSWNSHLDIDTEMERFFNGFYGEAADPMKRYWLRIDRAYATTPVHTGSQYGLHQIWTDALLKDTRSDIEAAKRRATSDRVKAAVAMAEAGLRGAELFMEIRKNTFECRFLEAAKAQDALQTHIKTMAEKPDPHWAHQRYAWGYYRRFTGLTVTGGAQVLKEGGRILVRLPDIWKFRKDETAVGAKAGWFRPELDDAGWPEVATFTKSWDDYGLRWYHGEAWYRTRFALPASEKDKPGEPRLWFGGFDYNVDVYLNGQHLGEKRGFAVPREFADLGKLLKFGAENVLAVRVAAGDLAELGTGGLMAPVMIYRARAATSKQAEGKGVDYEM